MTTGQSEIDKTAHYRLDDERRARVRDCLTKEGLSVPQDRFERLIRDIEASIAHFRTAAPGGKFRYVARRPAAALGIETAVPSPDGTIFEQENAMRLPHSTGSDRAVLLWLLNDARISMLSQGTAMVETQARDRQT